MVVFGGLIIGLVFLVAVVALLGIFSLDRSFRSLQQHEIATKIETIKIGKETNFVSRLTRNIMLGADFDKDMKRLDETAEKISKSFDALLKAAEGEEDKKLVENAKADSLAFVNDGKSRMLALKDTPAEERYSAFKEYEKGATPLAMKSRDSFDSIIKNADKRFDDGNKHFAKTIRSTFITIIAAGGAAVLLIFIAFAVLIRLVLGPINVLQTALLEIRSSWDLNKRLDDTSRDEMGAIAKETNAFINALKDVIGAVSRGAERVAIASAGLNKTAEQMAVSVEEVAAQASTVATASEEMSATTVDIANNCSRAAELSNRAKDVAGQGGEVVSGTVAGMGRIAAKVKASANTVESLGARSDQIGAIVVTIEDIADQTNLLALNAAIEAARAGEQGRGFAVVADEVRALAERTTRATREISEMIKAIQGETRGAVSTMEEGVSEVERGTEDAARSGVALGEIQEQINELAMQVHQIATAAEEQSATVGEITSNIHQISDVILTASKGTQEASRSAHELNDLAKELKQAVSRFSI